MSRRESLLLGAVGIVTAIAAWAVAAALVGSETLAGPRATVAAIRGLSSQHSFWSAVLATVSMTVRGLVAATVVGVLLGLLIGSSRWLSAALQVPLAFLRPIPPIVILPVVLLVVGPTERMGELLIFYGCFLPIAATTAAGVRETDPVAIRTARSYGLGRAAVLARVTLPSTAAFVGTAVRIAMPHAFVIAVLAGYLGGSPGLGESIALTTASGDTAQLFAIVVVLGWLALLLHDLGHLLERRLLHWHASYRGAAA